MNMRTEEWCGYKIRFVEYNGEWWAVLKDICDALDLRTDKVANRLPVDTMERVLIEVSDNPLKVVRSRGENKFRWMLVVNELGIYEALFASRKLEARKFRMWAGSVMQRLRSFVGLQGYEVMKMTDEDIQEKVDSILDCLYWDEETKQLMVSVTVQGGDVDQVPFDEYLSEK